MFRYLNKLIIFTLIALILFLILRRFLGAEYTVVEGVIIDALRDQEFWTAFAIGFLAQSVDGALGMAFGVTTSTFLIFSGATPIVASGVTHFAEIFTTGISGLAHRKLGNVDEKLFFNLVVPGILGGLCGVWMLSVVSADILKPIVSAYLLVMGLYIIGSNFNRVKLSRTVSKFRIVRIALFGGLMDTTGGGGWGPIVTTSLIGAGADPKKSVGTVNYAEFFITLSISAALFSVLDETVWVLVSGLIVGGACAAPFAAFVVRKIKVQTLTLAVGGLISVLSAYNIYQAIVNA